MTYRVIEFAATQGDDLVSSRVRLGDRLGGYMMRLTYRPVGVQGPAWYLSVGISGSMLRESLVVRERVDLLSGCPLTGRPPGSIVAVKVDVRGNGLDSTAFSSRRYELRYYPTRLQDGVL